MQYLRSLIFTTYMMVSACLFGALMALCFWLPYRRQFALARTWARCLLWVLQRLCGLGYCVDGRQNIPSGNHLAMSNHSSTWETVAPFVLLPPQVWVIKRELLWIPCVGWGLKLLRPIAIDRGAGHKAVSQVVEQGSARLADGLWVVIFPEGTRVRAGQQRKYGVSGALLAATAGKLILPISHNAGEFWPRRSFLKKRGTIQVVIGEPIDPRGKDPRQLNEELRLAIESGLARIDAARAP
ncbi:MAG TPA: lysophospholipid acyltransferase family protein [Steroidobacteraceae bacterium]|nr:lysophospholipid acyltransferase family protein [Steroidobacteraceae bacterium]